MDTQQMLKRDEGVRNEAYPDPLTGGAPWTIGVGHTGPEVHRGLTWTDEQVMAALEADIKKARDGCRENLPFFDRLCEPRQAVLISMAFQMGVAGLLAFKCTLASVRDERWADASMRMLQSLWAKQTPKRARRLAQQMETGEWQ